MIKKVRLLLISLVGFFSFVVCVELVSAEELGGVVQTTGEVGFYEGTTPSTKESSSDVPVKKPVGKLPSTGELIKKSLLISGSLIVVLFLLFFVYKQRKKE